MNVKAVAVFYLFGNEKSLASERLLVAQHRIEDDKELSHASGEGDFLELSTRENHWTQYEFPHSYLIYFLSCYLPVRISFGDRVDHRYAISMLQTKTEK